MNLQDLGRDAVLGLEAMCDAVRFMRTVDDQTIRRALTKTDASPVTVADFAVQAFIASWLERECPNDPLVGEEDATALRAPTAGALRSDVVTLVGQMVPNADTEQVLAWVDRGGGSCGPRFWTLDPIDGTEGLLRGGQYVIALALVVDGNIEVGILGCPRLSVTTGSPSPSEDAASPERVVAAPVENDSAGGVAIAVRARGAWWVSLRDGKLARLSVSAEHDATRARALHSREPRHGDIARLHDVLRRLGSERSPILMDSQAKHALLAAGAAELLLRFPPDGYHETIWDQAAGSLLIQEAGGQVSDIEGRALDFSTGRRLLRNRGLIASNGLVHEAAVGAVRESL